MQSKEEIESSKRNAKRVLETDPLTSTIDFQYIDISNLLEYIEKLEEENIELQKSVEQIYDDYQDIGKKAFEYSDKTQQLESREQKLIEKLEDKIMIVKKLLDEMLVDMGNGIKAINITGLTRKEKEEVTNKRNCLMVQKYCYEEILKILKGENDE